MGQDPEVIREQIEATRAEMSDTVDALGYKADVKARAKENVQDKVDAVTGRVTAVKEKIVGQASSVADAAPSRTDLRDGVAGSASGAQDRLGEKIDGAKTTIGDGGTAVKQNARQAASVAQENPLGLAIGAIAIGFLGGLLVPTTRIENEKIGPIADDLKEQVREAGQEAFDHGKAVADDAVHAAQEAAKAASSSAKDAAQTAAADAQEAASDAAGRVKESGQSHADDLATSVQDGAGSGRS